MADKNLIEWLEHFRETTKRVIDGADSFSTMVFLVAEDETTCNLLMSLDQDELTAREKLPLFREFGRQLQIEPPAPQFIVVAQLLVVDEQRAVMVFHGCSTTGERDQCASHVAIERTRWRRRRSLHLNEPFELSDADRNLNSAIEVLEGIRQR